MPRDADVNFVLKHRALWLSYPSKHYGNHVKVGRAGGGVEARPSERAGWISTDSLPSAPPTRNGFRSMSGLASRTQRAA